MSADAIFTAAPRALARKGQPLRSFEDSALALALGAMMVIPLAEAFLRRVFRLGIPDSTAIVQHLVLVVGMLGGAVAARESRLLALSNLEARLPRGRIAQLARLFSSAVSAAVTVFLAVACIQFVRVELPAGKLLAHFIPVWLIELVLPLGFGLIALRLLWRSSSKMLFRMAVIVLAAAVAGVAALIHTPSHAVIVVALLILTVATFLGAPAFATLGGATLILFWAANQPIASIPITHYSLVTNPSLPTLPLFTLAGYFLAEGGAPQRLVRVFYALFGSFGGGPAIVTVLMCAFFTSFTGASGVTILALGGLLMPILIKSHYTEKDSLGLLTGAGSLGILLPPCLPLIVYAIVAKVPIDQMFLAGILPAAVMMIAVAFWGVRRGSRGGEKPRPFSWTEARQALWQAKWELAMPVVASVALFGGFATPVEAAALTALYAFFIESVIHHDLKIFRDAPRVMAECGLLIGGVLLILGVALGFTNYLVDAQVPLRAVDWTTRTIHSQTLFLFLLNIFLLVVGCLVEIYPAIIIEVPLLVPLGAAYGVNPLRLGIIFLANMELGYLTPPVGISLLMSSYRFRKPVGEVLRSVLPVVAVLAIGVLLITYVPALTNLLPRWFGH
ncbi:MAG TPA: TRAP transporter large permease subunit [Candidatus Acidoferrales bacterium]|nr:TRAP transporter large permease subunit [Candidatus Acidoferrales bacterium]